MELASSDTGKTVAAAISAGSAGRPRGGLSDDGIFEIGEHVIVDGRGVAGEHHIDSDALGCPFLRQGYGQAHQAGHCRGVGSFTLEPLPSSHGERGRHPLVGCMNIVESIY